MSRHGHVAGQLLQRRENAMNLPEQISGEAELDALLARPYPELAGMLRTLDGDLIILGIAGKMGITLGMAAVRAIREAGLAKTVYGVSRFSEPGSGKLLLDAGLKIIPCDLLDRAAVGRLPRVPNVIYMAGRKFGTDGQEPFTWASNAILPANVGEHFAESRIVAMSTGCVYPLVSPASGGCRETDPVGPVGEYAQSCLARERVFQYYSQTRGTPVCLIRLSYACEPRYGVLHDIGRKVWQNEVIDLGVAHFNAIWQGDANNQVLLSLQHCAAPAAALNVTGLETCSVRETALAFGRRMGRDVRFEGSEAPAAYFLNAQKAAALFGPPRMPLPQVLQWTAQWIMGGQRSLNKPTHYEVRNGVF
jgi:nucleoside-diphosphate-sugar epimerase